MQHSPYTPCTDHPEDWWLPPTWPSPHAMVARPFRGRGKRGVHGTSYQFQQLSLHSSSAAEAAHRALQPFPRPKRSMRLSPHCAFQLGPGTHAEQTHGYPRGGAPVGQAYRHLLSSLRLFASLFSDLPWRTFTLSVPLQEGVRLLCRLRPLSRTLAFSRPLAG